MRLYLLGPIKVAIDDKPVAIKSSKILALLALVGSQPEPVSRHHLASFLWESFPQERAWANLRHAIHKLRSLAPEILTVTDSEVNLNPEAWVDIRHQDCCHLGTGEFCQGLDVSQCPSFETWLSGKRARWRDRTVQALLQKAHELKRGEQDEKALEAAHQALGLDPLSERAHAQVIGLLRGRGDFAAARRQWDVCLKTTLQELGTVPSVLRCWGPALEENAACKIYLLGQPRLVMNGAITPLPYQKTTALLAYLAQRGEAVGRQELRELLWPGNRPDKAAANLRHALHFLRKCVGDVLCSHGETIWLDPARYWLDTDWLKGSEQSYTSIGSFCEGLSIPDCIQFENWLHSQRKLLSLPHSGQQSTTQPPTPEVSSPRGNLPARLTTLVGVEEQIRDAYSALTESRLLTIVGPAGVGKTRLALEVGRRSEDDKQVWLVEYGSLFDPERVMPRLAAVLGVSEVPGEDLWQLLEQEFRSRDAIVVLDNCEHLITATAELTSQLLKRFPCFQVIATSRELLRVPGETVITLDPLQVPTSDCRLADDAAQFASVELFVTRARASRPQFRLRDDNAALVSEICRRLDGLPLAIELAAVRTRALSTKQIAHGLRDRFRLLRGGPRTVPQRQQTLEQALVWSYNLLTDEEKLVFCQLSVLAADFDLDAAAYVCDSEDESDFIMDTLSSLIDRSLVLCRESEEGFRYAMLETIRDFAYRELDKAEAMENTRTRHFQYFQQRASNREQQGIAGLPDLKLEHANFGLALDWALQSDADGALAMAASLGDYWFYGGHFTEGSDYLERALNCGECPKVYLWSGRLHQAMGDYSKAQSEFEKSAELSDAPLDRARAFNARAQAGYTQADYRGSKHFAESALELWKSEGHGRGEVDTLNLLATAEICLGAWERAEQHLTSSSNVATRLDYQWGHSIVLYLRGLNGLFQGHYGVAEQHLEQCLQECKRMKSQPRMAVCLANLGLSKLAQGAAEKAGQLIQEGSELAAACGYKQVEAFLLYAEGYYHLTQGSTKKAQQLLQKSLLLMRSIGVKESVELVLFCIAGTVEEEELATNLRRAALVFKRETQSVMPAYLGDVPTSYDVEGIDLEEAVALALQL